MINGNAREADLNKKHCNHGASKSGDHRMHWRWAGAFEVIFDWLKSMPMLLNKRQKTVDEVPTTCHVWMAWIQSNTAVEHMCSRGTTAFRNENGINCNESNNSRLYTVQVIGDMSLRSVGVIATSWYSVQVWFCSWVTCLQSRLDSHKKKWSGTTIPRRSNPEHQMYRLYELKADQTTWTGENICQTEVVKVLLLNRNIGNTELNSLDSLSTQNDIEIDCNDIIAFRWGTVSPIHSLLNATLPENMDGAYVCTWRHSEFKWFPVKCCNKWQLCRLQEMYRGHSMSDMCQERLCIHEHRLTWPSRIKYCLMVTLAPQGHFDYVLQTNVYSIDGNHHGIIESCMIDTQIRWIDEDSICHYRVLWTWITTSPQFWLRWSKMQFTDGCKNIYLRI